MQPMPIRDRARRTANKKWSRSVSPGNGPGPTGTINATFADKDTRFNNLPYRYTNIPSYGVNSGS